MRSLEKSAPSSKKVHLKQNAIEWSKTIVTDARVYDKVSTEKGGLPQLKALIRWTADENMIMKGLTKDHKELVRTKSTTQSKRTRKTKPEQTSTRPSPQEFHDVSNVVENEWN